MQVLALICSPAKSKKTRAAVEAVLQGAQARGAEVNLIDLVDGASADAQSAMTSAEAIVFASPTYRAGPTWVLKSLLDHTPRGEPSAPLEGKACTTLLTGASSHHFLAADSTRATLASFFGIQLLSPGLYFSPDDFTDHDLRDDVRSVAEQHGRALVDLTAAVCASNDLRGLRPLI
jgi:FMN reductase